MKTLKRSATILATAGVLFGAVACGGGDDGGTASTSQPGLTGGTTVPGQQPAGAASASAQAAQAKGKLEGCLRKAGIKGIPNGTEKLTPAQQLAVQKCGMELLGNANPAIQKQLSDLRACMEKRGAEVPPAGQPFVPNTQDPKVAAELKACAK